MSQTQVRVDSLKQKAIVVAGAFVGESSRKIAAAAALEAWLRVFDVGGAGTVTVSIRTSYLENPDIAVPADWHEIGEFTAIAVVGIATPLVFWRGDTPLGRHVSAVGTVATNDVEFEVFMVMKETL